MSHASTFDHHACDLVAVATEVATIIGVNTACRSSTFKLHWLHRRSRLTGDDGTRDLRERTPRERVGCTRRQIDKRTPHNAVRALIYSRTCRCGRRGRSSSPRFAAWTGLATDPLLSSRLKSPGARCGEFAQIRYNADRMSKNGCHHAIPHQKLALGQDLPNFFSDRPYVGYIR
jgi:hypothetical protein